MFTKADIEKYFIAEKGQAMVFMVVGIVFILLAVVLFYLHSRHLFIQGLVIPVLLIGIIQFVVGYNVHGRSDEQRSNVVYAFDMDPAKLRNVELPRMEKVTRSFGKILVGEAIFLIAGIIVFFVFRSNPEKMLLNGIAVGVMIQAIVCLVMDAIAAMRGMEYMVGLTNWLNR